MENDIKYAGFWVRVLAAIIDGLVLILPIQLIETLLGRDSWIGIVLIIILWWQYTAQMLSSSWKATVGKKVLGIEVLNIEHRQLTFKEASIRFLYSFISYVFILPILMMLFNEKKQTFHDDFGQTIVVDKVAVSIEKRQYSDNATEKETKTGVIKSIRGIGIFIMIVAVAISLYYFAMFAFVFGTIYTGKQKVYESSFYTHYDTNDFNDSRILYYQKELEKYSKAFIEAEGMYDIFAADTQKDLALNCIEAALKEHNVSSWIEMGSGFRKNARNKYAVTEEFIEKAKKNEDHMGKHFYYYDLNDVNHIEDEIVNIWEPKKNKNTCDIKLPIVKMYDRFMIKYIANREEALSNGKSELKYASSSGTLNKNFYKRGITKTSQWLETLYQKHPGIFKKLRFLQEKKRKSEILRKKREEEKKLEKKQNKLWKSANTGVTYSMGYFKDLDANIRNEKGQTLLMIAVKNGYDDVVNMLGETAIDVWAKDDQGKTAFSYIKKPKDRTEKIFSDRMYGALRMLEVEQIIKGKAEIIEAGYTYRTDLLKIKIKGDICDSFYFPKNTECTAWTKQKKRYKKVFKKETYPIITVIKYKKNIDFDKYLPSLKDVELKDDQGKTLLYIAVEECNYHAIEKLLKKGANMNAMQEYWTYTPFTYAAARNDRKAVKIFLDKGVNVNYQYQKSLTVLSIAVKQCNVEMIKLLLKNGADPKLSDSRNDNAITSLGHCNEHKNKEIKKLIMNDSD